MREITEHQTNAANRAIRINADDADPDNGNASHVYALQWREMPPTAPPIVPDYALGSGAPGVLNQTPRNGIGHVGYQQEVMLRFQHGPIGEVGVNGVTNEALLAIVADRLRGFQSSKYACKENAAALASVMDALGALESRTRAREARGVEGTHTV